jgi:hypothetical protein
MSLEAFARERLQRELIGFRKNGLKHWLRHIARERDMDEMEKATFRFIPDGTRLRRQPAFNPRCEPWDVTLELWEIEDTSKLTMDKLGAMFVFAHDLFDVSSTFTEVWVCDRYGLNRQRVFDVREYLAGGDKMTDRHPQEWWCDDGWKKDPRAPKKKKG